MNHRQHTTEKHRTIVKFKINLFLKQRLDGDLFKKKKSIDHLIIMEVLLGKINLYKLNKIK